MREQIEMLKEFNRTFNHPIDDRSQINNIEFLLLRDDLHQEEIDELRMELARGNISNLLKEGADVLYVLLGTFVSLGLGDQLIEAFKRVHLSNMSKLGLDGKPIYREDGKVLKGPHYLPPDLGDLV